MTTAIASSLSSDHESAYLPSESAALGIQMTTHLRDRVEKAIEDAPHLNRQHLRFEANEGHVTIKGTVGTYFQKQMAQEALRRIDGVEAINNELEVCWKS